MTQIKKFQIEKKNGLAQDCFKAKKLKKELKFEEIQECRQVESKENLE